MAAANTDKFKKVAVKFSTTVAAPGVAAADSTTAPLASASGLPTDTACNLTFNRVNSEGTVQATYETATGVVSGSNFTNMVRGVEGTASPWPAGTVVECLVTADAQNDMVDGILAQHTQAGAHGAITTTSITSTGDATFSDGKGIVGKTTGGTSKTILALDTNVTYVGNAAQATVYRGLTHTFWDTNGDTVFSNGWLPAGETWTYASADDPTYTFTIAGVDLTSKYSAGMRIKLTQTTVKYFIITKVAFSTNTTITVYGGTDYDLANAAITLPFYSTMKAPVGFPLDVTKWQVLVTDSTTRTNTSITVGLYYNVGSTAQQISVPIGAWQLGFSGRFRAYDTVGYNNAWDDIGITATLSTANNSLNPALALDAYNSHFVPSGSSRQSIVAIAASTRALVTVVSKTTYYLNLAAVWHEGHASHGTTLESGTTSTWPVYIFAICAYL